MVSQENTYTVQLGIDNPSHMRGLYNIPTKVKFVAHSDHPLPNPQYLFIHAACCRVAHLSGAAKYLDEIFLDMEELSVLAEDGASANSLVYALHQFVDPG